MSAYWLGVLTTPAVFVAGVLTVVLWFRAVAALARRGITATVRWRRDLSRISDYTLRHDIWWERSFGPVFAGGWYHERLRFEEANLARINRWVGIGCTQGPSLIVFHSRDLGEVRSTEGEA